MTFGRPETGNHPPNDSPGYRSTALRHPNEPLIVIPHTLSELPGRSIRTGGWTSPTATSRGSTPASRSASASSSRAASSTRTADPLPQTLVEIWQANAAGRYTHKIDQHAAPLDPNFSGRGPHGHRRRRPLSVRHDPAGRVPVEEPPNAWRPAHIHFSLFGTNFLTRLITQMYFPGDPLLPHDPIFNSIPDERARARLIAGFSLDVTEPEMGAGIHVRHRAARIGRHADGGLNWRS